MKTIGIAIFEQVESVEEMVDLLNHVATQVKDGYTKGYHPGWMLMYKDDNATKNEEQEETRE